MRRKVSVVGGGELSAASAARIRTDDYADVVVDDVAEIPGSDVVVLAATDGDVLAQIRDRAPNAVVVVTDGSVDEVCRATLFPRARIIGVEADPAAVAEVVEAVALDRGKVLTCTVRCEGEHGIEGEFAAVPVRVGAGGVKEILERV